MPAKILVSTEGMPYADWLEYRKQGIGGSDASVVCGINRYKSPVELWMKSSRRQVISSPADLSHHRAYRPVHGGSTA